MSIYDKASLVLIPSGTKTSKVYSQKPVNGDGDFTFSRSTAATRVNADGNIEKETQNLFNYSNNFGASYWLNNAGSCTRTGGQAGYDGTNDAWLLTQDGAGFDNILSNSTPVSGVYTFSVYAKANSGNTQFTMRAYSTTSRSEFNLTTGTISASSGVIDDNIEDVGGGWYRCSVTFNASSDQFQIYPQWNSSSAESVYIQDVQLEQGLVARDYIETTTAAVEGGITDNVPRLDYTDSSCPALLLEPQRTNGIAYSEYFDSYWDADGQYDNITITHNATASPEGLQNATKLVGNSTSNNPSTAYIGKAGAVSSQPYVSSVFAKAGEYDYIVLTIGSYTSGFWASFNLDTGEVDTDPTAANTTASIEDYGDGWYRCMIHTTNTGGAEGVYFSPSVDGTRTTNYTNTTNGVYIFGAQVEAGSYATSYIPTYGTSVTRNQDDPVEQTNLSTNNILNNYNSTAFIHIKNNFGTTGLTRFLALYSSAANNPRILFYSGNNGGTYNLNLQYRVTGQSDVSQSLGSFNLDDEFKFAIVINGTSITSYLNGVKKTTSTITQGNDIERLFLDDAGEMSHLVSKLLLFPTSLTDQEAIDLTTI